MDVIHDKIIIKKITIQGMQQHYKNVITWGCDEVPVRCHVPWGALWLLGVTLAVMTALKIGLGRFPQVPSSVTRLGIGKLP